MAEDAALEPLAVELAERIARHPRRAVALTKAGHRRPLALDDDFAVGLRVADLTRRGLTTEFRFRRLSSPATTSEGHIRRRVVDMRRFRGADLPDDLHEAFSALADELAGWPDIAPDLG